jgi:hypothetical protein
VEICLLTAGFGKKDKSVEGIEQKLGHFLNEEVIMKCHRCNGKMVFEQFYSEEGDFFWMEVCRLRRSDRPRDPGESISRKAAKG